MLHERVAICKQHHLSHNDGALDKLTLHSIVPVVQVITDVSGLPVTSLPLRSALQTNSPSTRLAMRPRYGGPGYRLHTRHFYKAQVRANTCR